MWADPQVQSEDKAWIIDLDKMDQRSGMLAKAFICGTSWMLSYIYNKVSIKNVHVLEA